MRKSQLAAVLLGVTVALHARAATYYVSNSGNDSNSGAVSAPWRNCPGMPGWSGGVALKAGDVVCFNNTGTWTSSADHVLRVTGGVTYDGRTWGSGTRALFRALSSDVYAVVRFTWDHPTLPTVLRGFHIDGSDIETSGIGIGWPTTSGSLLGATKRVEDCVIHDVGFAGQSTFSYGIIIGALSGNTTRNVEILNCVVYNTGRTAIGNYCSNDTTGNRTENVLIRGCEIYRAGDTTGDIAWGILLKNHIVNTVVEFNYLHDMLEGMCIETHGAGFTGPENLTVRYNIIKSSQGNGILVQNPGAKSFEIYGNLILQSAAYGLFVFNTQNDLTARIYNNTFFQNCVTSGSAELYFGNIGTGAISIQLFNNLVSARSGRMPLVDSVGNRLTHGNNLLYRPDSGVSVQNGSTAYTAANLSAWEPTGLAANPGFKNAGSLPSGFSGDYGTDLQPNTDGLSVVPSGSAVDKGRALPSSFAGAINVSGKSGSVVRPGAWDIGAYEVMSSIPAPPSNLRVVQ